MPSGGTCLKQVRRSWPNDLSGTRDTGNAVQVLPALWRKASVWDGVSAEFPALSETNRQWSDPFRNRQPLPDRIDRSKTIDRSAQVPPPQPVRADRNRLISRCNQGFRTTCIFRSKGRVSSDRPSAPHIVASATARATETASARTSLSLSPAFRLSRRRLVLFGTVGGRIAPPRNPSFRSC